MRKVVFTTGDTERAEKAENLCTTETQRHREKQTDTGKIRRLIQGLKEFLILSVSSVFSVVNLRSRWSLCLCVSVAICVAGCARKPDPNTLVMIIESSPINLDPRVGVDSQSQRIDELLFDSLLRHDEHFQLQPWLAERWEIPDPLTYIFHLHHGVRFHNGQR